MNEDAAVRFSGLPGTALALAAALSLSLIACGDDTQPPPDIEATVEARVEQVLAAQPDLDAIVEAKVALALTALPAPTPIVVVKEVLKEADAGRPVEPVLAEDAFEDIFQNGCSSTDTSLANST